MAHAPKRHHYVPQMLLRRFANAEGGLYYFDKRFAYKGVSVTTPQNLFLEGHLYSHCDDHGAKSAPVERYFSDLDGLADQIVDKIAYEVRRQRLPGLTVKERVLWNLFFYYQWKRVPDVIETNASQASYEMFIGEWIAEFQRHIRPLTDEERRNFENPSVVARIKQSAKVDAIAKLPNEEIMKALGQKGLAVAHITKPSKSFVIGSFPIVKLNHPGRTHMTDPSVEMWFPIAHDVAVTPAFSRGVEEILSIKDHQVRHINMCLFKQSSAIAGRSKALIESLVYGR